jgi:hypothetical protein
MYTKYNEYVCQRDILHKYCLEILQVRGVVISNIHTVIMDTPLVRERGEGTTRH